MREMSQIKRERGRENLTNNNTAPGGQTGQKGTKTMTTDSNGRRVFRDIRREEGEEGNVWGVNVWFGCGWVTNVRRYYYATRAAARKADISDEVGKNGRIE